jgi:predicted transposase YbfD/YdcC
MGCQKEIARKIKERKGDYILALKGNQKGLYEDVAHLFDSEINSSDPAVQFDSHEDVDYGHSRLEKRKVHVTDDVDWLPGKSEWESLRSLIMVESDVSGARNSKEKRYFISSCQENAAKLGKAIRSHWSIENSLHWILDVTFKEDGSRIHNERAAENMAIIRHTALNLLQVAKKQQYKKSTSIKSLRKLASWSEKDLSLIFTQRL